MQTALLSSWTLFFGIFLVMAGNGLQGVLLGTRAEQLAFGDIITGIVMSGYFAGLMLGSLIVPKLVSRVGHIRVFGTLAGLASSSILVHALLEYASIWTVMRLVTGFSYAGMYIVAESWINDKATNATRGTLLSVYMMVTMSGLVLGQFLLSLGQEEGVELFLTVSILVSIAVLPILLTAAKVPDFQEPERVSIYRVYHTSPLAVIGMAFTGTTAAMIFGMGAVYSTKLGNSLDQTAAFMAAVMIGAMLLQYPIGKLSDVLDRRLVILITQAFAALSALLCFVAEDHQFSLMLVAAGLYGGASQPLYSLYIAHANDFLTPRQIVGCSSMLIMINGIGAVFGAPLVGVMMSIFGTGAFFLTIACMQSMMAIVVMIRMRARQAMPMEAQGSFVAVPNRATQMTVTLIPDAEWVENEPAEKT